MNKCNSVVQLYGILVVHPYEKQYCVVLVHLENFFVLYPYGETLREILFLCVVWCK